MQALSEAPKKRCGKSINCSLRTATIFFIPKELWQNHYSAFARQVRVCYLPTRFVRFYLFIDEHRYKGNIRAFLLASQIFIFTSLRQMFNKKI